jgi:hypothetical protein
MKIICIAAALMAVMAAAAFAQSESRLRTEHASQATPYHAYGGKKRHTDPDPTVLFEMTRQRNWRKG